MPTLTIVPPRLHEGQRQVWHDPARFKVVCAGRRWGKSRTGGLKCIWSALQGERWWWVWPNFPNSEVGWRIIKRLGMQVPGADKREVTRLLTFPGGGWVQIKSADKPESLRSEGLDGVIVDEAAHTRKFLEVWEQSLRPALSDRLGDAWFISTPAGYNDFYELYRMGEDGADDWASFRFPTWANPFIDADEIEAARQDLPDLVFRQEYGAEFVQLAGALFQREWFEILEQEPSARYVRFWDLAASTKEHADYTVGAKVGMLDDGTIAIADVVRGRWDWPKALKIISQTARSDGWAVQQGIEDVGVQKGMYQMLLAEPKLADLSFIPVRVTKDKLTRANPWLARAEQGKVVLVQGAWNRAWLDEICAFPEVNHDDQVDAVSGAVQMISGAQVEVMHLGRALAERRERQQEPAPDARENGKVTISYHGPETMLLRVAGVPTRIKRGWTAQLDAGDARHVQRAAPDWFKVE